MTETTTPPPQVVAWMRNWRRANPAAGGVTRPRVIRAWMDAHGYDSFAVSPYGLGDLAAACRAAERTLTVADVPAGQGAASLFLAPDPIGGGEPVLWFKAHDGRLAPVSIGEPRYRIEVKALWEHLAATLPTVTEEA